MIDPSNRERGLKAAMKNPRVSEQAKQRDREILENEYGKSAADPEYIPTGGEAEEETTTTTKTMPKSKSKVPSYHTMPESEAMMPESSSTTMPKKSSTETTSAYSAKKAMPESMSSTMPKSSAHGSSGTGTTSAYSAEKSMPAPASTMSESSSMPKSSGSSNTISEYSANKPMRTAAPPTRSGVMLPEETETKNPGNVIGGLKAAIANKNVSEAAKGRDHQKLRDLGAE